ncbi:nickel pincer cofactor biosynthesis protein LarC [Desulfofundulus salinus]|uniref:Pyridinium-3,5-bisthiocarboxylic acid mononucleotide nickel insertion protein n=1 Tax=Desulfofundulus salinus TaxID=2419843 RepID=A0A494WS37_9FIRM|nr:nickel pincer cofactor biosynthesis protein LarC [Desulfofundulus salinum]RKO65523.1 nickel pincer cofactor biosynthesis protein LarC [Desulfofundulus salinum]
MNIAYLDCVGGISGEMLLAALIDGGVNARELTGQLNFLHLGGFEVNITEEVKGGWRGIRLFFSVDTPFRSSYQLGDVLELIASSSLPAPIKKTAGRVFERLACAEARVRGISPREVCFEGGQFIKSVLAVTGSCLALFMLQVERVYCSPLPVGHGPLIRTGGVMPVPAPATAELMLGVPVYTVDAEGELVTADGAAIATTLAAEFGPLPPMQIAGIGYGIGAHNFSVPNLLRVFLGKHIQGSSTGTPGGGDTVLVMETDIDDMNPEFFSYVDHLLRQGGALDVFLTPTIMKKGRPGTRLTVLCPPALEEVLLGIIFRETTTLGVRIRQERRSVLNRHQVQVQTPWGQVGVKVAYLTPDNPLQVSPEYEDCRRLAESSSRPIQEIYHAARQAALDKLQE